MPASRRMRASRGSPRLAGSRRATKSRAAAHSSSGLMASTASATVSSSTPRWRSSWLSARRASPRLVCRELTQAWANASSSTRPTSLKRSSTRSATSSGTSRERRSSASCARVFGAMVSRRSTIARATDSGSASGSGGPSGPSSVQRALRARLLERRRVPPNVIAAASDGFRRDRRLGRLGRTLLGRRRVDARSDAELLLDLLLDLIGEVGVVAQERPGVLLALAELVAVVGVPSAGLADEALLDTDVDQPTLAADAGAEHQVHLGLPERRRHLVLDHLDPHPVADCLLAVLERLDASHVEPHRRVELQRLAARRRLRAVVHHHAVDEVVVAALHLDVEAVHRASLGLDVNVQNAGWDGPQLRRDELRLHIELASEAWQQLVVHRRVHVRSDELMQTSRRSGSELQHRLLEGSVRDDLAVQAVSAGEVLD